MKTAVEWLFNQLSINNMTLDKGTKAHQEMEQKILEKAKQMDKEQKGYSLDDVKNALHSVELKDNKNYSKIWEGMENCFELIKQQKA